MRSHPPDALSPLRAHFLNLMAAPFDGLRTPGSLQRLLSANASWLPA
jgi:hypothetical protein